MNTIGSVGGRSFIHGKEVFIPDGASLEIRGEEVYINGVKTEGGATEESTPSGGTLMISFQGCTISEVKITSSRAGDTILEDCTVDKVQVDTGNVKMCQGSVKSVIVNVGNVHCEDISGNVSLDNGNLTAGTIKGNITGKTTHRSKRPRHSSTTPMLSKPSGSVVVGSMNLSSVPSSSRSIMSAPAPQGERKGFIASGRSGSNVVSGVHFKGPIGNFTVGDVVTTLPTMVSLGGRGGFALASTSLLKKEESSKK